MKATLDQLRAAQGVVNRHLRPTPTITWPLLAKRTVCEVWVKHENHTPIGAFKVRGGLVYMDALRRETSDISGVMAATRGNHGQSVAFAARVNGLRAVVTVPHGNNPEKNAAMEAFGAELVVHGHDFQASLEHAAAAAEEQNLHFMLSFHDRLVAGVGTYALEFFDDQPDLDVVYVPIGLGSGICGVISARDALGLKTEVVGVVAENAAAYAFSFEQGEPVSTNSADTIADGMACRVPNAEALLVIRDGAADIVRVGEDEIAAAMRHYFVDTHNIAEGAGAASLAALMKERDRRAGQRVGLILSGGNADRRLFRTILEREDLDD